MPFGVPRSTSGSGPWAESWWVATAVVTAAAYPIALHSVYAIDTGFQGFIFIKNIYVKGTRRAFPGAPGGRPSFLGFRFVQACGA